MSSKRDKNVVNLILNPALPFGIEQREEEGNERKSDDEEKCSKLPNYRQSEELSLEGVNLAEKGDFENAMEKFDEAIKVCPENASPYNNRAQLFRLLSKIPEALRDLEKALELCGAKGRIAAQSFVQKALIHQFRGEEAMAKADFEQAAKLGSTFAKNQLIAMNPYAAMCNKMLGEMMSKFRREEH
uniref:Tetratricopeptide repeat protein 36 n=1 Tax=Globodera rostochiensis TaxID=31243 RepID=A0A914HGS5_GLORO